MMPRIDLEGHDGEPRTRPTRAPKFMLETRVVAVLRAEAARDYRPVVEALLAGGVRSIELTLSTDGVFGLMPTLIGEFGEAVEFGVGTVTEPEQVVSAVEAGATYIVTPGDLAGNGRSGTRAGHPCDRGGTDSHGIALRVGSWSHRGQDLPSLAVRPRLHRSLARPVPRDGVRAVRRRLARERRGLDSSRSIGGPLTGDAFKGGSLADVTARAQRLRGLLAEVIAQ